MIKIPFMKLREAPPLDWREPYPTFTRLAVETHSTCNRRCRFCPTASGRRDGIDEGMADDLYESICRQLEETRWEGFVELFVLNEPLADPRILERAARMRAATPKSTIYASTNGDHLMRKGRDPLDRLAELLEAGVNSVNLNVYDSGEAGTRRRAAYDELIRRAEAAGLARRDGNKYARKPPTRRFLHVSDMRTDREATEFYDVFFDKTAESKTRVVTDRTYCSRTHRHLVVLYDGRAPLCCATDPTAPDCLMVGDAREQPLLEIWSGEEMAKHRFFLQDGLRGELAACRHCRHRMAYPHCVRKIEAPAGRVAKWRREERR